MAFAARGLSSSLFLFNSYETIQIIFTTCTRASVLGVRGIYCKSFSRVRICGGKNGSRAAKNIVRKEIDSFDSFTLCERPPSFDIVETKNTVFKNQKFHGRN